MNIILFTNDRGRAASIPLGRPGFYLPFAGLLLLLAGALLFTGYQLGSERNVVTAVTQETPAVWETELEQQQLALDAAQQEAAAHLNALALRLGQMQAQLLRVDALGKRLAKMADLDEAEFDFDQPPAQGGPEAALEAAQLELPNLEMPDFMQSLEALQQQLNDRQRKLTVLEGLALDENLKAQVQPTGHPVEKGWISSYFGKRTDPFTGKPAYHHGMDFAGKKGSNIVAVAAGMVTFAGYRSGYGKLVEIDHGNGLVTRYGHNQSNLVQPGDRVEKGQPVALMGSSGRSTGPHVHFEVLKNGRVVNPRKYIAAR